MVIFLILCYNNCRYSNNKCKIKKSKNINKANNVTIEEVREATENVKISEINNEEIGGKSMSKLKYDEEYDQNKVNLETIRGILRSRRRDNLNEAVNERLDKIEKALEDGQFISEEDLKFAIHHGGGPYQRSGGGDFRRIDIMRTKQANHFATREYIEGEKQNAIGNQMRIKGLENRVLDHLEDQVYAGDYDTGEITEAIESIKKLRSLRSELPQVDTESVKQPHLRTSEEIQKNNKQLDSLENELQLENDAYEKEKEEIEKTTSEAKKSEIDAEISAIITEMTQEKDISIQEEKE